MHVSIPTLPFGGFGESGNGAYHGRSSFDAFVHRRSITSTPGWVESVLAIRYPPYAGKINKYLKTSLLKPDFDRDGRRHPGVIERILWILTLGGGANKSGVIRTLGAAIS